MYRKVLEKYCQPLRWARLTNARRIPDGKYGLSLAGTTQEQMPACKHTTHTQTHRDIGRLPT